jgi:hypothetical protein
VTLEAVRGVRLVEEIKKSKATRNMIFEMEPFVLRSVDTSRTRSQDCPAMLE